jgi:hypothetical protein
MNEHYLLSKSEQFLLWMDEQFLLWMDEQFLLWMDVWVVVVQVIDCCEDIRLAHRQ